MFLSLQGEIFLAERTEGGDFIEFLSIGDAPVFEVGLAVDKTTVRESMSGFRRTALTLITGQDSTITLNMRDFKAENAALMMYGVVVDVAMGTITAEPFPIGVGIGDRLFLDRPGKISALSLVDSAATPLPLVAGTHYVHDGYGGITFLAIPGTQPYKATYTVGAIKRVPILTQAGPERWLRFMGKNTAAKNADGSFKRVMLDLFRVSFNPGETLTMMQENDVASIPVTGTAMADDTKPETTTDSQYGNLYYLD